MYNPNNVNVSAELPVELEDGKFCLPHCAYDHQGQLLIVKFNCKNNALQLKFRCMYLPANEAKRAD